MGALAAVLVAAAAVGSGLALLDGGPQLTAAAGDLQATSDPAPPAAAPAAPGATAPANGDRVGAARTALDQLTATAGLDPARAVSVAALDTVTGASIQYGAGDGMSTASVVKLEILVASLVQHQDDEETFDSEDRALASSMICQSDNDAAIALFDELGGTSALVAMNMRLGLTATDIGSGGYFGFTTSSAPDQITLLRLLTDPGSVLTAENRAYALDLMRSVESDQDWGVSAAADAGTQPALKNGWLPVDDDDGLWAVGSVGTVTSHGHPVLLAVLVQHLDTEGAGIDYIEQASRIAAAAVSG